MSVFVTITGHKHYFGLLPFSVGTILSLRPDPDNIYDPSAISVYVDGFEKAGYVAQSSEHRADGTVSASSLLSGYTTLDKAIVRFIAGEYIIAEVMEV